MSLSQRYRVCLLANGYVRVDDRASGLTGLYNRDGSCRSGFLRLPAEVLDRIRSI